MLKDLGIIFNQERIPALLYADDTVLMASSEEQLQKMLNVSNLFATKWGLKFNSTKSNVMVIGKRINAGKAWMLGDLSIQECTSYKYLGILFCQSLSDTGHIKTYLKPKAIRLKGYLCSILASHDNINRVSFGYSLWKHVLLPALSHGCAV